MQKDRGAGPIRTRRKALRISFVWRWAGGTLLFAVASIAVGAVVMAAWPHWGYFIRGVDWPAAIVVSVIIGLAYGSFLAVCWLWPAKVNE